MRKVVSGGCEMTSKRRGTTTPVDESPALWHGHRIGMTAANVVIGGVGFVGKDVKDHHLIAVVVLKRGRSRRAAPRSSARTFHVFTLSLGTVQLVDRWPIASPPWPSRERTQTTHPSRRSLLLHHARMDRPEAREFPRDAFPLLRISRIALVVSLVADKAQRPRFHRRPRPKMEMRPQR